MPETPRRWEAFIVFTAVLVSVPIVAMLATGILNLFTTDREGLEEGILLAIIALAAIWMTAMGVLWLLANRRRVAPGPPSENLNEQLAQLQEENRRLREIVSNLSEALDNLSLHEREP